MEAVRPSAEVWVARVDLAVAGIAAMSLLAAVAGLPLYADGAHYLFRLLVDDAPYVPDGRLTAVLPQLPALVASRIGGDLDLIRLAYAVAYGSLPVLSIWTCWLILRRRAPALMLFVALAAVLDQINFSAVSELLLVLYLTWPVALVIAVAPEALRASAVRRGVVWASGPLLVLLHPVSVAALLLLAFAAAAMRRLDPSSRRAWTVLGAWFLVCAGTRMLISLAGVSDYESSHLAGQGAVWYLLTQTWAQHGLLLAVTGIALLAAREALASSTRVLLAGWSGWIAMVVIAALTLLWSTDILWGHGIRLKSGVTFVVSLLLLGCALVVAMGWRARGPRPRTIATGWAAPLLACLLGVAVLTGVKTAAWWTATRGLQNVISDSTGPCLRHSPHEPFGLQWPWMVIVDEWNAPMNALLFRPGYREPGASGLAPIPVLLPDDGCARLPQTGLAYMTPWLPVPWERLDRLFGPLRPPWFRADSDTP